MAQQTVISYSDDLDGTEAAGTVRFGDIGTSYETDPSKKNTGQCCLGRSGASARTG